MAAIFDLDAILEFSVFRHIEKAATLDLFELC